MRASQKPPYSCPNLFRSSRQSSLGNERVIPEGSSADASENDKVSVSSGSGLGSGVKNPDNGERRFSDMIANFGNGLTKSSSFPSFESKLTGITEENEEEVVSAVSPS